MVVAVLRDDHDAVDREPVIAAERQRLAGALEDRDAFGLGDPLAEEAGVVLVDVEGGDLHP